MADRAMKDTPNPILSLMVDEGTQGRMTKFRIGNATMIVSMFQSVNILGRLGFTW